MIYLTYTCETCDTVHYPVCHLHMTSMLLCLNHLTCLFPGFHSVSLFCYYEGNPGYMNSGNGDIEHMVYIWGFSCLDYPLNVSISWIQSLSLYNWFYPYLYLSHAWCLFACLCIPMLSTLFLCMFSIQIYRYTYTYLISDLLLILCFPFMYWSLLVLVCLNHITWLCTHVTTWVRYLASS